MTSQTLQSTDIDRFWEAFLVFDSDNNGTISATELAQVMRELQQNVSPSQLREMIREVDSDGSGTIDYDEFRILMASSLGDREARLRIAFEVLDVNQTNSIQVKELEPILLRFGLGKDELSAMFQEVDLNGDGVIDFDEFSQMMPDDLPVRGYPSEPQPAPPGVPDDIDDPVRFDQALQEAAEGDDDALRNLEQLIRQQVSDVREDRQGTSRLQIQIGIFRLLQGAAYRCFRESFSANYETHLRVRNLPYRVTDFVEFTKQTLEIYKGLGIVDEACFPVIDELNECLAREFAALEERVANWASIEKSPAMQSESRRMEAVSDRSEALREKLVAGIEFAITLRKKKLTVRDAVEGVLALHELNRLRRMELDAELQASPSTTPKGVPLEYLKKWNRVILTEASEHTPGAMMPVAFWYEKFMPRLLAAMSVTSAEDVAEHTTPNVEALDAWYTSTQASGAFARYGADVEQNFMSCEPKQKLAIRQSWRLTEHYLNGLQKRREREEFGRNSGALSQYVAFLDVYLDRTYVRDADMRATFPYYLGPAVWRLFHTSAEIVCGMPPERQKSACELFVPFFERFASMYPCPYCRHHLNAYVVQNREVEMYPLEYLMLGHDPARIEFEMSARRKLKAVSSGQELRLFFWKLHNTVNASIARQESWYQHDERAFYTTRYWPSLDSELTRAQTLRHISIATSRIAAIYGLLKPAARLAGLRAELQHLLENRDEDDIRRVCKVTNRFVDELEDAVVKGGFLQQAYTFDPKRIDAPPSFSDDEEKFARSGAFVE